MSMLLRHVLALLGLFTLLASPVPAQDPGKIAARFATQVPAIAKPLSADQLLSGCLAIAYRGEIVYRASYGMADYDSPRLTGPNTQFCVASVSKPITALAVARLADEGRLDLDATVGTWIKGFPSGDKMTLMHLLEHTAGIPHRVTGPTEQMVPITASEIVARVKERGLLFQPGAETRYSTAGYSVVARIIEIVTGKDYDAAMRELVFDPLGMKSTCHGAGRGRKDRALCYQRTAEGIGSAPRYDLSFLVGGGSLYATADDLVRLGVACSRRAGLPKGTWKVFAERLGWMKSKIVRWNGKTNQFGAFLDLHTEQDLVVAFTGNIGVAGGELLRSAVPQILAGKTVSAPSRLSENKFTDEEAAPYLGEYVREDGIRTRLRLRKGILSTRGGVLLRIAKDRFFSPSYGCHVTFDKTDDGKVTALVYRPLGLAPIIFKRAAR